MNEKSSTLMCTNTQTDIPSPYATEESDLERADGISAVQLYRQEESRQAAEPKSLSVDSADFLLASKNLKHKLLNC